MIFFGSKLSFSLSHFCFASPLKSLGIVSTGMLLSAQNLRHNIKRPSCSPVSSEISLVTFGFSSATLTLPYSVQPCWQLFHSVASFPPRVYPPANMKECKIKNAKCKMEDERRALGLPFCIFNF